MNSEYVSLNLTRSFETKCINLKRINKISEDKIHFIFMKLNKNMQLYQYEKGVGFRCLCSI